MAIALAMMSASAAGAEDTAELGATTNADSFVLSLTTEFAPQNKVVVTSSDGTPSRDCVGSCNFAYLAGASLSLRIPFPTDRINCVQQVRWTGACAGQGKTCNLVLNSNLSTEAIWVPIRGCDPR
jgi:hypothetical protein